MLCFVMCVWLCVGPFFLYSSGISSFFFRYSWFLFHAFDFFTLSSLFSFGASGDLIRRFRWSYLALPVISFGASGDFALAAKFQTITKIAQFCVVGFRVSTFLRLTSEGRLSEEKKLRDGDWREEAEIEIGERRQRWSGRGKGKVERPRPIS